MSGRPEGQRPVRMRVGRDILRGPLRIQKANGKAYLASPNLRELIHAVALKMDAQFSPKVVAPVVPPSKPKAKRKVSVKRAIKTKAKTKTKAKVKKRRK